MRQVLTRSLPSTHECVLCICQCRRKMFFLRTDEVSIEGNVLFWYNEFHNKLLAMSGIFKTKKLVSIGR